MPMTGLRTARLAAGAALGLGMLFSGLETGPARVGGALAQGASCKEDFERLAGRRQALIGSLSAKTRGGKSKLDPIAACPKLRSLAAVEGELLKYVTENKDWCGIPDEIVTNVKQGRAKTAGIAQKACAFAEQMRKARAAAARGETTGNPQQRQVRLPTGPL